MGFGKFWRRDGSDTGETQPVADRAVAEDAVWEWFAAGLAWTLFTLPEDGILTLVDEDGTGWFAQFGKASGLRAEVGSGAVNDASGLALAERGWRRSDENEHTWYRYLRWPARYTDYEELADAVVGALGRVAGVWLPLGLRSQSWNDGFGPDPDVGELAVFGLAAERMRAMTPATLHELAGVGMRKLGQTKVIEQGNHQKRTIVAGFVVDSEGWELLTGGGEQWPMGDRTVDFVALAGTDRLVALDVYVDIEDPGDIRLDNRVVEGERVERGTAPFVAAAVRANPDLADALAARDLLTAFHDGRMHIDYQLLTLDSAHGIARFDIGASTENPRTAASDPAPPTSQETDIRWFPLLKPADWPHRGLVRYQETGSAAAPIAVVAEDREGEFAVAVEHPDSVDFRAQWGSAIANLEALHYDWEIGEVATIPIANCSGHDFSAEKILDPNALRVAHRFLKAPRLGVSVPRRTCLMAAPTTLNQAQAVAFAVLIQRTYADDSYGHAPITSGVYVVEDGHIIDFVEDPEILHATGDRR
ncbi:TY-Chap domain-containing protein [Nocardia noduli]|uniref:TY-Chap domain-containing protein n=1 Tax=Nocardia noduli TaxID=2815722 RepID=UPI001C223F70|nr:hypothetical protein [Nocardia noduli]